MAGREKYAVIVAGGSGTRMGGGIPKQFRRLNGKPVLWWSIKAFHDEDPATKIIVVIPEDFISLWEDFYSTLPEECSIAHKVTGGGSTRSESVRNGLRLIDSDSDSLIAIHDGARPLIRPQEIAEGWKRAEEYGAAVPAVPVTDSLRETVAGNEDNHAVDRSRFVAVQTPQVFKTEIIRKGYEEAGDRSFTDDASVAESIGQKIYLYPGDAGNIKITHPLDIEIASILMQNR